MTSVHSSPRRPPLLLFCSLAVVAALGCAGLVMAGGAYLFLRATPSSSLEEAKALAAEGKIEDSLAAFAEVERRWPESAEARGVGAQRLATLRAAAESRFAAGDYDVAIAASGHAVEFSGTADPTSTFSSDHGLSETAALGYAQLHVAPDRMKYALLAATPDSKAPPAVKLKAQAFLCAHSAELPWIVGLSTLSADGAVKPFADALREWEEARAAQVNARDMVGWCGAEFDTLVDGLTVRSEALGLLEARVRGCEDGEWGPGPPTVQLSLEVPPADGCSAAHVAVGWTEIDVVDILNLGNARAIRSRLSDFFTPSALPPIYEGFKPWIGVPTDWPAESQAHRVVVVKDGREGIVATVTFVTPNTEGWSSEQSGPEQLVFRLKKSDGAWRIHDFHVR